MRTSDVPFCTYFVCMYWIKWQESHVKTMRNDGLLSRRGSLMAEFEVMLEALARGLSVQRAQWEPGDRLFVSNNSLMWQSGSQKPTRCALTWEELAATDWRLYEHDPSVYRVIEGSPASSQVFPFPDNVRTDTKNEACERQNASIFLLHQK